MSWYLNLFGDIKSIWGTFNDNFLLYYNSLSPSEATPLATEEISWT